MESWILRVSCKVNVKPFGLHLLCTRPEVFMIPWTFQKLNSFLNKTNMPCLKCLVESYHWRWQEKLLCSVVWHYHQGYVQHYMANLMLVQCLIARHAEVWTCQFWRESWLLCLKFVFLVSRDGWVALPRGDMGLSAVCDCGISWSYSLTIFGVNSIRSWRWPWYRSQKEWQCQLKVNIMSNRKKVMLTKDAPLKSHLADYFL